MCGNRCVCEKEKGQRRRGRQRGEGIREGEIPHEAQIEESNHMREDEKEEGGTEEHRQSCNLANVVPKNRFWRSVHLGRGP